MDEGSPEAGKTPASLPARLLAMARGPIGLGRFVRFAVVGLSGVFVDMPIFWALYNYTSLPDLVAILPAYAAATVWNFMLNDAWTFRDRREKTKRSKLVRFGKYALVSLPPLVYRLAAYWPLKELSDLQYMLAYTVAIIVGMAWNFGVNFLWTWRKRSQEAQSDG
ncbi:MAG: GtrA family protein [Dehalococcoidia bacterium]|nr:GtrA family protein [Dehalococcoidia bacterium]